ncbi:MAG: phage scaffolding protein [Oscillospiraceae bacterium]|jgi:flagellar motility protein MotE (MotC chaperone)|nr:phage scaffolding protein [Oscillospiraceae bacterium]
MTLQEILKAQGLTDEQITKVVGDMKQNKIFTATEENLDIRYKDLQSKHGEATGLIEQLKKDNAGNEALQSKVSEYEGKISELEAQLKQTQVDSALKVALLEANVVDVDYLTFKIKEQGEIKLDDKGNIKGLSDTLSTLKTQYPNQFAATENGGKKIEEIKLPQNKAETYSIDTIKGMSADEIAANWEAVETAMASSKSN